MHNNKFIALVILALSVSVFFTTGALNSNSPSACSGQWTSCSNAFGDNTNRATATQSKTGIWNNYGFSIKDSATINGVLVRTDFFASKTTGFIDVKVSGDGGATYGPVHEVGGNTAEQTFIINVTSDISWTGSKLNDSNFKVNITCIKNGGGPNPTCNLDWVPMNVTYTPFDFSVSTSPTLATVVQARSTQTEITLNLLGGNSQNVALSQSGCPPSASCTFNVSSGSPTFKSNLTIDTTAATPAGIYTVNITGTGDGLTRTTAFTVNVTDSQPVATPTANPTSGNLPLLVNFTGSVLGGDPPLTYLWDFKDGSNSTSQNPQHTFSSEGLYNVSFTATDFDGDSSSNNVLVNVTNPFNFFVLASPTGDAIVQGGQSKTSVTVGLLSGSAKIVSLAYSGCPTDATCSFNVTEGAPLFKSNFSVATASTTPIANYTINITGTNGTLTKTTFFRLNVTA